MVHRPLILQIQTYWPRLLRRLCHRNSKELHYTLSGTARRIHALLHHSSLLCVRSSEDCMHMHDQQARNGVRKEKESHYEQGVKHINRNNCILFKL